MKFLIFASLFSLINSAPNHNPSTACNTGISRKSVNFYYQSNFCKCVNYGPESNRYADLDFPFYIFTTDASTYLSLSNSISNQLALDYHFDRKAKMNDYCNMFKDFKWKCERGRNGNMNNNDYNTDNNINNMVNSNNNNSIETNSNTVNHNTNNTSN